MLWMWMRCSCSSHYLPQPPCLVVQHGSTIGDLSRYSKQTDLSAKYKLTTLIGNAVHAWSLELSNPLQYMESPKTLFLAASILPESNNEKMQLILKTLMALCTHIKRRVVL